MLNTDLLFACEQALGILQYSLEYHILHPTPHGAIERACAILQTALKGGDKMDETPTRKNPWPVVGPPPAESEQP